MSEPTKSFTVRLPESVYDELERIAGEGKRSEFVIDTLKQALGFKCDREFAITSRVERLEAELKDMTMRYGEIIGRLKRLEEPSKKQLNLLDKN